MTEAGDIIEIAAPWYALAAAPLLLIAAFWLCRIVR